MVSVVKYGAVQRCMVIGENSGPFKQFEMSIHGQVLLIGSIDDR